jgi:hypothetical protein
MAAKITKKLLSFVKGVGNRVPQNPPVLQRSPHASPSRDCSCKQNKK